MKSFIGKCTQENTFYLKSIGFSLCMLMSFSIWNYLKLLRLNCCFLILRTYFGDLAEHFDGCVCYLHTSVCTSISFGPPQHYEVLTSVFLMSFKNVSYFAQLLQDVRVTVTEENLMCLICNLRIILQSLEFGGLLSFSGIVSTLICDSDGNGSWKCG
jgi:hypothetical protein